MFLFPGGARADLERIHEVSPLVVFYSGDVLRSSVLGGFSYTYHATRLFWVGADFMGGELNVDNANSVGLLSGQKYLAVDGALYFNIPVLLGVTMKGEDGMSADLYTAIGAGKIWLGDKGKIYGFFGGGMVLYTGMKWLAFRFDLKGLFFSLANGNGSDFNSDMTLSLGPSFVF